MKKKILIACSNYYPHSFGGTEVYVEAYAKYLKQQGFSVYIITSSPEEAFQQNKSVYEDDKLRICNYTFNEIDVYGAKYKHISTEAIHSKQTSNYSDSWISFININPAIQNIDILHIHSYTTTIGLDLFNSIKLLAPNVKTITSYHTPLSCPKETLIQSGNLKECQLTPDIKTCTKCIIQTQNKFPYPILKGFNSLNLKYTRIPSIFRIKYLTTLNLRAFESLRKFTDEWWCYSDSIKNILILNGVEETQIKMVRHGISEIFLTQEINKPTAKIIYLFTGRLIRIKGILTLLKSWLKLPLQKDKELWLTTATFSSDERINELLQQAALRNDVIILGEKNQLELAQLYAKAHFVIIPSECFEIGPFVFHEAIANRCNVICSDIGGCKELAAYYNMQTNMFEAGNQNSLTKNILESSYQPVDQNLCKTAFKHFSEFLADEKSI